MRKKILIGVVSLVAGVSLWFGLGIAGASAHTTHKVAVHRSSESETSADTDNIQSGDQTTPDTARSAVHHTAKTAVRSSASADPSGATGPDPSGPSGATGPDPSGTEGESTTPETDNVDCQQVGNFDGVNQAGTGPGCDGSGT